MNAGTKIHCKSKAILLQAERSRLARRKMVFYIVKRHVWQTHPAHVNMEEAVIGQAYAALCHSDKKTMI